MVGKTTLFNVILVRRADGGEITFQADISAALPHRIAMGIGPTQMCVRDLSLLENVALAVLPWRDGSLI
jgi:ABC-type branched-subunit amino acid transport system ATPase component